MAQAYCDGDEREGEAVGQRGEGMVRRGGAEGDDDEDDRGGNGDQLELLAHVSGAAPVAQDQGC